MVLQLLLFITLASTHELLANKYSHLKLPTYPIPDVAERDRISSDMFSLYSENMARYYSFGKNLTEDEDSFYHRYEHTCFEYMSAHF